MCLDKITRRPKKWTEGYGFKAFQLGRNEKGKLTSWVQGDREKVYPKRRWLHEKDYRGTGTWEATDFIDIGGSKRDYRKGFHVLESKIHAFLHASSNEVVHRVKYRKCHTVGVNVMMDGAGEVYVATEMIILEQITG